MSPRRRRIALLVATVLIAVVAYTGFIATPPGPRDVRASGAIAKAELAWWVARRIPGKDSPENVGALIADLNAQFYGVPREKVLEASVLRARAGHMRDEGGPYRSLHAGVN